MMATDVDYEKATAYLEKSNGHVKSAILMILTGEDLATVQTMLKKNDGFIKKALIEWQSE